jgi:hypothetical protein
MERRIRANDAAHNLQFNYSVNEAALLTLGTGRDWEKRTDREGNEMNDKERANGNGLQ